MSGWSRQLKVLIWPAWPIEKDKDVSEKANSFVKKITGDKDNNNNNRRPDKKGVHLDYPVA